MLFCNYNCLPEDCRPNLMLEFVGSPRVLTLGFYFIFFIFFIRKRNRKIPVWHTVGGLTEHCGAVTGCYCVCHCQQPDTYYPEYIYIKVSVGAKKQYSKSTSYTEFLLSHFSLELYYIVSSCQSPLRCKYVEVICCLLPLPFM